MIHHRGHPYLANVVRWRAQISPKYWYSTHLKGHRTHRDFFVKWCKGTPIFCQASARGIPILPSLCEGHPYFAKPLRQGTDDILLAKITGSTSIIMISKWSLLILKMRFSRRVGVQQLKCEQYGGSAKPWWPATGVDHTCGRTSQTSTLGRPAALSTCHNFTLSTYYQNIQLHTYRRSGHHNHPHFLDVYDTIPLKYYSQWSGNTRPAFWQ